MQLVKINTTAMMVPAKCAGNFLKVMWLLIAFYVNGPQYHRVVLFTQSLAGSSNLGSS